MHRVLLPLAAAVGLFTAGCTTQDVRSARPFGTIDAARWLEHGRTPETRRRGAKQEREVAHGEPAHL